MRKTLKPSDIDPDSAYVGLEHLSRRSIALYSNGSGCDVDSNKNAFNKGDILFGKLRPYFHKVSLAPFGGVCSTDILVLRPVSPDLLAYCTFAFFQDDVVEHANLGSGGTRMPRTNWDVLGEYSIFVPNSDTIFRFNCIADPIIRRITHNLAQIRTLGSLRDTLLPKLISGEVRVAL